MTDRATLLSGFRVLDMTDEKGICAGKSLVTSELTSSRSSRLGAAPPDVSAHSTTMILTPKEPILVCLQHQQARHHFEPGKQRTAGHIQEACQDSGFHRGIL